MARVADLESKQKRYHVGQQWQERKPLHHNKYQAEMHSSSGRADDNKSLQLGREMKCAIFYHDLSQLDYESRAYL